MNLLLLLSALLSAITGVTGTGARVGAPAERVALVSATVAAAPAVALRAAVALETAFDALAAMRRASTVVRLAVPHTPLYATRRRE